MSQLGKSQMHATRNQHSIPMEHGLISVFDLHSAGAIVAWQAGSAITQERLLKDVSALLEHLPDQHYVIIDCQDQYHFLVCFLAAVVKKQIILFPSNFSQHGIQAVFQYFTGVYRISDAAVPLRLTGDDTDNPVRELETISYSSIGRSTFENSLDTKDFKIESDRVIGIAYTSGSTGEPTCISKTWGGLWHEALLTGLSLHYQVGQKKCIIATVPSAHMYGFLHSIVLPLRFGFTLHHEQPFFSADVRRAVQECPMPVVLVTTPMQLRQCVSEQLCLDNLTSIISSAAPLDRNIAIQAESLYGVDVLEIFGSTETGGIASRHRTHTDLWQCFNGMKVVTHEQGFHVSGSHLPSSVTVFDQINIMTETQFHFIGRNADLIKIGGKRASLTELNQHLLQISAVEDGVMFMPEDRSSNLGENRLAALVVAPGYNRESLLAELRQRIDPVFLPKQLRFVSALPRTATGKLPRRQLLAFFQDEFKGKCQTEQKCKVIA